MGPLDRQTGRFFIAGSEAGMYILGDDRQETSFRVDMPGGRSGRKAGRTTGEVRILFTEIYDNDFRQKLDLRRKPERVELPAIDLLPDGEDRGPMGCVIGSAWGAEHEPIERVPFSLHLP